VRQRRHHLQQRLPHDLRHLRQQQHHQIEVISFKILRTIFPRNFSRNFKGEKISKKFPQKIPIFLHILG
jgi:hypothetical protein